VGAWGPGNLDNGAALDLVEDVAKVVTTEIGAFCASDRCTVEDLMRCCESTRSIPMRTMSANDGTG